ncbi:putative SpoVT / AbrB like domain protein [Eubacterium sp. CAG:786]|nr:putative SpoVT / AbrB like domain protein [Eubacterium sp. CAG:786]
MDKKFKKLTKSRGLTIPRDMAARLDLDGATAAPLELDAGTAVDLTASGDGKLIITRHIDTCRFCGGAEKVKQFGDIYCCPLCATKLYQEVTADE